MKNGRPPGHEWRSDPALGCANRDGGLHRGDGGETNRTMDGNDQGDGAVCGVSTSDGTCRRLVGSRPAENKRSDNGPPYPYRDGFEFAGAVAAFITGSSARRMNQRIGSALAAASRATRAANG